MPSKNGFGNTRTPMTKKASYGSAMHYKNPIKNYKNPQDYKVFNMGNPVKFNDPLRKASAEGKLPPKFKKAVDSAPLKKKEFSKEAKNLLKAVPNKAAYDKLSSVDKKGFDKAAKKAGLPQKKTKAQGNTLYQ